MSASMDKLNCMKVGEIQAIVEQWGWIQSHDDIDSSQSVALLYKNGVKELVCNYEGKVCVNT